MHKARLPLTDKDLEFFQDQGFLFVEKYCDVEAEIMPLLQSIHRLVGILLSNHCSDFKQPPFSPETFDSGMGTLAVKDRRLAGIVYDGVKRLPQFIKWASHPQHMETVSFLLQTDFVGFASRGWGMRMDHPNEDKFLTQLHQDYVTQLCSPKGIVFWSPLRRIDSQMGPIIMYPGSHKNGIYPIEKVEEGSYGVRIENDHEIEERFPYVAPELEVGDMVIVDYLLLHKSSPNRSQGTRWSMVTRFFDLNDPTGQSNGWKGGLQEGNSFETLHPDLTRIR